MSLYHEAASVLSAPKNEGGSIKSRVFGRKDLKSPAAQVYALALETCKWSAVLKEVVENAQLLLLERKVGDPDSTDHSHSTCSDDLSTAHPVTLSTPSPRLSGLQKWDCPSTVSWPESSYRAAQGEAHLRADPGPLAKESRDDGRAAHHG